MPIAKTMTLCSSCSCHVRGERVCPFCGADLAAQRSARKRSAVALSIGLALAMSACTGTVVDGSDQDSDDTHWSDDDGNGYDDGYDVSAVSTYGCGPSCDWGDDSSSSVGQGGSGAGAAHAGGWDQGGSDQGGWDQGGSAQGGSDQGGSDQGGSDEGGDMGTGGAGGAS